MKKNISQGSHYLISFWGCNHEQIESVNFWKKILTKSASEAKLIVLGSIYHKFNPHGITGILLLSSSHMSVHTWPEHGYVACDMFSCTKDKDTIKAVDFLKRNIQHEKIVIKKETRGYCL